MEEEIEELMNILIGWSAKHGYKLIVPRDDESFIDFININLHTKSVYFESLDIKEPLTDVG